MSTAKTEPQEYSVLGNAEEGRINSVPPVSFCLSIDKLVNEPLVS